MTKMVAIESTILVVEDDLDLRRLFEQALFFEGFRVLTAANGGEALHLLNRETPALVVLDLLLPWVNGLEVLATMRRTPRLRAVPVLIVTGTPTGEHDLRDFKPLMVRRKPMNIDALTPLVQQLLARSRGAESV